MMMMKKKNNAIHIYAYTYQVKDQIIALAQCVAPMILSSDLALDLNLNLIFIYFIVIYLF
jgi:hypothetical protein